MSSSGPRPDDHDGLWVRQLDAVLAIIAIAEFVPNEMRGVITAVYFLLIGLLSTGLGPFAVGLATDYLFQDKAAIGRSLSTVSLLTGIPGALLLAIGLRPFRESLGRATWIGTVSRARAADCS
jgi:MFS family permease